MTDGAREMKSILKLHYQESNRKLNVQKGWWWQIQFIMSNNPNNMTISYYLNNKVLYRTKGSATLALRKACKRFNVQYDKNTVELER